MAVTERTKKHVWATHAGRCAICRELLVENGASTAAFSLIGDIAHIVADQHLGPRGGIPLSAAQRDHPDNLVLLCLRHHRIVDDDPVSYTVERLRAIRDEHTAWVDQRLSAGRPWNSNLHNLFYVNVPRLGMLAQHLGEPIHSPAFSDVVDLRKLGGNILPFLQAYGPAIDRLHPNAIPLESLPIEERAIGSISSFTRRFRTKNVGKSLDRAWKGFTGTLSKDPHIYTEHDGYRFVLPIDPCWLTTSTAGVHLSSGQGTFAGLFCVNSVDHDNKHVLGSPLVLGHPKSELLSALFG